MKIDAQTDRRATVMHTHDAYSVLLRVALDDVDRDLPSAVVQAPKRFVKQQKCGLHRECAADSDALLFTTAEFMREGTPAIENAELIED